MSDADVVAIGDYTAIRLFRMREERLKASLIGLGGDCEIIRSVCHIFKKELDEAGWKVPVGGPVILRVLPDHVVLPLQ